MERIVDPNITVPRQYYAEVAVSWAPNQSIELFLGEAFFLKR